MIEGITLQLILRISAAILMLWFVSLSIRRTRIMWPFLPLFIYFLALCTTASAEFYEVFNTDLQALSDAVFLIFYIWMLAVLIRIIKRTQ
ncbi:MAG: hypothetical protein UY16_C0048G0005 [Candidatus Gottesmanbacteria bacterium GW2011_GWA2_47_9]|uniref:Uncharacterized protein n=1 Tax=Candidatus Gottesmanbacteria bacterium GW2011_GWA2_47_9 TaxID=1618445 RepID=A0A0G1WX64_9BACT|nr:MAG: hypothetical protein UY16_C0048G0005 [Candidatus Gottesmanbacteria bacterium GW2011_GWA2_47_9]